MDDIRYYVTRYNDGSVGLIRVVAGYDDPRDGVENFVKGKWEVEESGPQAHYVLMQEVGVEVTEDEAREVAKELGGSI